jgi:hypothetical protein
MKVLIVGICFALAGLGQSAPERVVVVCFEPIGQTAAAERIATDIYAQIGVELQWRYCRVCPAGGIRIGMTVNPPASLAPGALAYTTPYGEGTVRVFFDRLLDAGGRNREIRTALLGHVLAHEIGHVLQGISRHSEGGVMKARWEYRDVLDMLRKPFSFTAMDEQLIGMGLEARWMDRTAKVSAASRSHSAE